MRKALAASALWLSATLAVAGCVDDHTGEVGQKNIRPYYKNEYEKNGIQINGVHSYNNGQSRRRFADDGATKMNRRNGDPRVENYVTGLHGNHHLEWSDRIAVHLEKIPGVKSAHVIVTDRNAYVAVVETSRADHGKLHDKIADHVRAMSPTVQNVYVSSDPEFVARMNRYAAAIHRGSSVQRYLTEFNAMVQRIFPSLTRSPDSVSSGDTAGMGAGVVGRNGVR
jgi:YhcN/YlaJ family sporulation lipoprotein